MTVLAALLGLYVVARICHTITVRARRAVESLGETPGYDTKRGRR